MVWYESHISTLTVSVRHFPWTAVTGYARRIPKRSLETTRQSHESDKVFFIAALSGRTGSCLESALFCCHFIHCWKPVFPFHIAWATCLCQHTIKSTHSLTNDRVRAIKSLFLISSVSCVDDKPIRMAELKVFAMFPTNHHFHQTINPYLLVQDLIPCCLCVRH